MTPAAAPLRVVAWGTGNVGRHAIAGIDARPDLELAGVWVSNPAKVGRDAGDLAGLGRTLGVVATGDVDEILALRPDCVVHTAMADDRLLEAIADIARLLAAGINVVSSGPVFLQFPEGVVDEGLFRSVVDAAGSGGVSLFVNGVDPGFANDALPMVLTGISERIDVLRCTEILNYATYDQAMVLFDIMGFARPLDAVPMLLQPGVLTMAWGSVIRQLAAGLDVELDGIEEWYERVPPPRRSRSTRAPSPRAPRPDCTSRCGACAPAHRSSSSSTRPGCATTSHPTGRSRPDRGATAYRSRASPTTPSTSSSSAATATTTPPV